MAVNRAESRVVEIRAFGHYHIDSEVRLRQDLVTKWQIGGTCDRVVRTPDDMASL